MPIIDSVKIKEVPIIEREREMRETWMGEGAWETSGAFSNGLEVWACRTYHPNQASAPRTQQRPVQIPLNLLVVAITFSSLPSPD